MTTETTMPKKTTKPRPPGRPARRKVPAEGRRIFRTKLSTSEAARFRAVAKAERRAGETLFRMFLEAGMRWLAENSDLPEVPEVSPADKVEIKTRLENVDYQKLVRLLESVPCRYVDGHDVPSRETVIRQIVIRGLDQLENHQGLA